MRIVFIINSLAHAHGVEHTLTDKANYLSGQGHSVMMLTYEQGQHPLAFPLEEHIRHIDINCRFFTLYRYSFVKQYIKTREMRKLFAKRLLALIKEFSPDILVATTYSYDFIWQIMSVSSLTKIAIESHTAYPVEMVGGSVFRKIKTHGYINALKKSDMMITLTKGDTQCWRKHLKNVISVVNPVSFYYEGLNKQRVLPQKRIIGVGKMCSQKRFDRLINAFALIAHKYDEWTVDIYGDGEDREKLEALVIRKGLSERVSLHQPTNDIMSEYLNSEIFVLSSDYEGLPLVLLEAMACGVAPIATKCPFGPDEVINDGVNGLLADMDVHDLSEKIDWLISHETERKIIAKNAYVSAARYRKDVVMKEWEEAYLSIAKS